MARGMKIIKVMENSLRLVGMLRLVTIVYGSIGVVGVRFMLFGDGEVVML